MVQSTCFFRSLERRRRNADEDALSLSNRLSKKLKDAEGRLQASASAFEQDQSDLETRLEEVRVYLGIARFLDSSRLQNLSRLQVRAELQTKRREEKELRNNEKQYLNSISSLESDIAKLTKSLEKSRENYDSIKRNYTETCEEAERLRTLVAETRRVGCAFSSLPFLAVVN